MTNNEMFIAFDDPIPYKELYIYPVRVKDIHKWGIVERILILDKNNIPDQKVITMSYLGFIYYLTFKKNEPAIAQLNRVFEIVLRDQIKENIRYVEENKKPYFYINGTKYNAKDLDNIINIICEQNGIEQTNYSISKELREKYEKAKKIRMRANGSSDGNLEDKIACIAFAYGYPLEYIYELSLRRFEYLFNRIDLMLTYNIFTLIRHISQTIDFKKLDKNFPKHWASGSKSKDQNNSEKIDFDKFKTDMSKVLK